MFYLSKLLVTLLLSLFALSTAFAMHNDAENTDRDEHQTGASASTSATESVASSTQTENRRTIDFSEFSVKEISHTDLGDDGERSNFILFNADGKSFGTIHCGKLKGKFEYSISVSAKGMGLGKYFFQRAKELRQSIFVVDTALGTWDSESTNTSQFMENLETLNPELHAKFINSNGEFSFDSASDIEKAVLLKAAQGTFTGHMFYIEMGLIPSSVTMNKLEQLIVKFNRLKTIVSGLTHIEKAEENFSHSQ